MATGRGGRGVSQLACNHAALTSASASPPYPKSGVISGRPSLMWLCIADLELDAAAREFAGFDSIARSLANVLFHARQHFRSSPEHE